MLDGIDVSRHQGRIDWGAVRAHFAFIRATVGKDYTDPNLVANADGANSNGILFGVYHVVRHDSTPAEQYANIQNAMAKIAPPPLPVVLDIEVPSDVDLRAQTLANASAIADMLLNEYGYNPIVYTAEWWIGPIRNKNREDAIAALGRLKSCPLWVASYTKTPIIPQPWTEWKLWQYTNAGRTAGIEANVDRDKFYGTLTALLELAKPRAKFYNVTLSVSAPDNVSVTMVR